MVIHPIGSKKCTTTLTISSDVALRQLTNERVLAIEPAIHRRRIPARLLQVGNCLGRLGSARADIQVPSANLSKPVSRWRTGSARLEAVAVRSKTLKQQFQIAANPMNQTALPINRPSQK
jgi:hypothetical protein